MSERDDTRGVPKYVEPEHTVGTRTAVIEKLFERLERDIKERRAETDLRLKEGAAAFAELRAEIQRVRDAVDGKVSSRHAAVNAETEKLRIDLEAQIKAVGESIATLANEVAPRATATRIIGWIAAVILAIGGPVIVWTKTPDRAEYKELDTRVRACEMRLTEVNARLGARGAQP